MFMAFFSLFREDEYFVIYCCYDSAIPVYEMRLLNSNNSKNLYHMHDAIIECYSN